MPLTPTPFVDAHHHLWDLERHEYDWLREPGWPEETEVLGDYAAIRRTYLATDLLRDAAGSGLVKSVHVQADWSGRDPVDETRWLQGVADATGVPTAIVAHADLASPAIESVLARHLASPNVRGIRSTPSETQPDEPAFRRGIAALGRARLSYDLRATPMNAVAAARLAASFPDITFIVGHAGEPLGRAPGDHASWRSGMQRLAEPPNVMVKISGLGMRDHSWTVDSIRPWVLGTIEVFGVHRCMFGTNWPVDSLYSSYTDLVSAYRAIVASLSAGEQAALLAGNAERIYRI
jgi:predicted TIM-barrel fold metal-dependent hydrolase